MTVFVILSVCVGIGLMALSAVALLVIDAMGSRGEDAGLHERGPRNIHGLPH